jgi:hypothetical protein
MDKFDKRIWYTAAAVVVVLVLAWVLGWPWLGGEAPATTQ